jgi:hypothetical protein
MFFAPFFRVSKYLYWVNLFLFSVILGTAGGAVVPAMVRGY